jgi:F420-dependent oxidoreductase-like protein
MISSATTTTPEWRNRVRFALMIEPQQGLTYAEQLAIVQRAESVGFESFFRSDHYQSFPGPAGGPTTDAWAVLAGLARETRTITLGTLVSPVTFRPVGNLAKVVTTVDEMSGGRVEFGLGAGWHELEHRQLGLPFPEIAERGDILEEQLAVLHGLWGDADGWSYAGDHVTIDDAQFHPKPVVRAGRPTFANGAVRPLLLTGGGGTPRSMRIAARYTDEFNLSSASPETAATKFAELDEACRAVGRDPSTMRRSVMAGVLLGRNESDVERRKQELLAAFGDESGGEEWFDAREPRWVLGMRNRAREMVARFEEAGAERIMLQDFLPRDLEMIDLMAEALF